MLSQSLTSFASGVPGYTGTEGLFDVAETPRAASRRAAWKEVMIGGLESSVTKGSATLIEPAPSAVANSCRSRSIVSPVSELEPLLGGSSFVETGAHRVEKCRRNAEIDTADPGKTEPLQKKFTFDRARRNSTPGRPGIRAAPWWSSD